MHVKSTLTIVIPVYNDERYLDACLQSIARQTVMPHEVIVVDNNSTDHSAKVARTYDFVRVVPEPRQGIVFARTTGYNAVRTGIIGRIDADTLLPVDWVERVQAFYENPEHSQTTLTGGGYFYNIRLPRFTAWIQGQLAFRVNRLASGHYIVWGSNMALPILVWEAVKDKTCNELDIHEDMDLAVHLHKQGFPIAYRESLRVGVRLRRVWHNRDELRHHMQRWPLTLHRHGYRLWWFGVIGNVFLWYVMQPLIFITEGIARLFGKPSIKD